MTRRYAEGTHVTPRQTKRELIELFDTHAIGRYAFGAEADEVTLTFEVRDVPIRLRIPLPDPTAFGLTPLGRVRPKTQRAAAVERETFRRWRALLLFVKAGIEAVESGLMAPREAFAAGVISYREAEATLPEVERRIGAAR